MSEMLKDLGDYVAAKFPDAVETVSVTPQGELTIVARSAGMLALMAFLRDDARCLFKQMMDVCGADYPQRADRFEVVYNLLSLKHNIRARVKVRTDEDTPVPSMVGLFPTAGWFERETWDMYGVLFSGHPDLRRILTDYGFEGHPLRKDFPLTGHVEVRYDDEQKRIVYEPVKLTQEFRSFDFLSPWEALTDQVALPGDEKAPKFSAGVGRQ